MKGFGFNLDFRRDTMEFATTYILNLLGYTPEDMANAPFSWDEITHPEDLVEVRKRLHAHLEGKTPFYPMQYRTKAKNGEWHWILGYCKVISRDENNKPLEAMGTHVDIHRLKCTEEELRRSELHFQTLVENASIGLVLLADRRIPTTPGSPTYLDIKQMKCPTLKLGGNWLCPMKNQERHI